MTAIEEAICKLQDKLPVPFVIGVTGHKRVVDSKAARKSLLEFFEFVGENLDENTPVILLSALATGADRWFALAGKRILGKRCSLGYVMPYDGYEKEAEQQSFVFEYLKRLAEFTVRAGGDVDDGDESFYGKQPPPRDHDGKFLKYFSAGEYIRLNSNLIVAVWDGKIKKTRPAVDSRNGGTGDIVKYCRAPDEYRLNDLSGEVRPIPVWIISSARDKSGDGFEEYKVKSVKPETLHGILRELGWLNRKLIKVAKKADYRVKAARAMAGLAEDERARSWIYRKTILAGYSDGFKKWHNKLLRWIFCGSAIAGFFAQAFGGVDFVFFEGKILGFFGIHGFKTPGATLGLTLLFAYAAFAFAGFIVYFIIGRREYVFYGGYRAMSEILRVKAYWTYCGINDSVLKYGTVMTGFEQKTGINLIRNWRVGETNSALAPEVFAKRVDRVCHNWLDEQYGYFEKRCKENAKSDCRRKILGLIAYVVSLGFVVWFLGGIWRVRGDESTRLNEIGLWCAYGFLVGIGPFIMACFSYVRSKHRYSELAVSYRKMMEYFGRAKARMRSTSGLTPAVKRQVLKDIGERALAETQSWHGNIGTVDPKPII